MEAALCATAIAAVDLLWEDGEMGSWPDVFSYGFSEEQWRYK
jgi:hypothetical protein